MPRSNLSAPSSKNEPGPLSEDVLVNLRIQRYSSSLTCFTVPRRWLCSRLSSYVAEYHTPPPVAMVRGYGDKVGPRPPTDDPPPPHPDPSTEPSRVGASPNSAPRV